jgi:NTE family protein
MADAPPLRLPESFETALVLGGGNALGAYHLGACEGFFAAGLRPNWLVGTSIGAVTVAILAGNPPERRLERLRTFWREATQGSYGLFVGHIPEPLRSRFNNGSALLAMLLGRPGLFGRRFPGLLSILPFMPPDLALRDHRPLRATLERLVDFDRLNSAPERVSINAIDMVTGNEIWFDNRDTGIEPDHLLASTALAPLFPPIEIGGRLLCDAGFGNNLPFDRVFREEPHRDLLCVAVDVYHLGHGRPRTLDETIARVQDLGFAFQSHRALAGLVRERSLLRRLDPESPSAILAYLAYRAPGHQRALKPLDFSRASLDERVEQGRADAASMLARIAEAPRDAPLAHLLLHPAPEHEPADPLPGASRRPGGGRPAPGRTSADASRP